MRRGRQRENRRREAARGKQSAARRIQRLIGRSLRAVTDRRHGRTHVWLDCDVIEGTAEHERLDHRCIFALALQMERMVAAGILKARR